MNPKLFDQLGCLENLAESMIELCVKNGDECKVCSESNCNARTTFVRCLNCAISDDRQCAINPQKAESKICAMYDDQCFTHIERFNVLRGCALDKEPPFIDQCRSNAEKCEICDTLSDGNDCNNRAIAMETCVECDSVMDQNCHENPHEYKDKICSNLDTDDRLGCYLKVVIFLFS